MLTKETATSKSSGNVNSVGAYLMKRIITVVVLFCFVTSPAVSNNGFSRIKNFVELITSHKGFLRHKFRNSRKFEIVNMIKSLDSNQMRAVRELTEEQRDAVRTLSYEQIRAVRELTDEDIDMISRLDPSDRDIVNNLNFDELRSVLNLPEDQFDLIASTPIDELVAIEEVLRIFKGVEGLVDE